jgi:hypothetical protein
VHPLRRFCTSSSTSCCSQLCHLVKRKDHSWHSSLSLGQSRGSSAHRAILAEPLKGCIVIMHAAGIKNEVASTAEIMIGRSVHHSCTSQHKHKSSQEFPMLFAQYFESLYVKALYILKRVIGNDLANPCRRKSEEKIVFTCSCLKNQNYRILRFNPLVFPQHVSYRSSS